MSSWFSIRNSSFQRGGGEDGVGGGREGEEWREEGGVEQ